MAREFTLEVWVLIRSLNGCILYSGASHTGTFQALKYNFVKSLKTKHRDVF